VTGREEEIALVYSENQIMMCTVHQQILIRGSSGVGFKLFIGLIFLISTSYNMKI